MMLWRQHFLPTTSTAARIQNDVQNIMPSCCSGMQYCLSTSIVLTIWEGILVDKMYRVPYGMRRYDSFGRCCICCNGGLCLDDSFKGNGLLTSCACNAYNFCGKARRIPDVPTRPQLQTTPSPELRVNNTTPWFFMSALHWTPHMDLLLIFFCKGVTPIVSKGMNSLEAVVFLSWKKSGQLESKTWNKHGNDGQVSSWQKVLRLLCWLYLHWVIYGLNLAVGFSWIYAWDDLIMT